MINSLKEHVHIILSAILISYHAVPNQNKKPHISVKFDVGGPKRTPTELFELIRNNIEKIRIFNRLAKETLERLPLADKLKITL